MKYRRSSEKRNFGEEKNSTTTLNKVEAEFNEILNYVESVDDEALVSDEKYWKVTPLLGPPSSFACEIEFDLIRGVALVRWLRDAIHVWEVVSSNPGTGY